MDGYISWESWLDRIKSEKARWDRLRQAVDRQGQHEGAVGGADDSGWCDRDRDGELDRLLLSRPGTPTEAEFRPSPLSPVPAEYEEERGCEERSQCAGVRSPVYRASSPLLAEQERAHGEEARMAEEQEQQRFKEAVGMSTYRA